MIRLINISSCVFAIFLCLFYGYFNAREPSLREKIGQMLIIGFQGKSINDKTEIAQFIDQYNIGGVILFDWNQKSQVFDNNIESPEQVKQLTAQLNQVTLKANRTHHRTSLPLLISIDYEGGLVNRLHPNYGFPVILSAKDVGKMSFSEAEDTAKIMANTLKSAGFNLNYAPLLDVDVNPDNPIIGKKERSFSSVPDVVSQYAQIYSGQFLAHHLQCAYKHFPGHGSSVSDSHVGFVDISDTWSSQELEPYLQLLSHPNHCAMVMVAHIINRNLDPSGLPATLSSSMISGLLRHDLQFDGVVISDDMQMKAIADYYGLETALTLSINAGVDQFIFGNQLTEKPQDPGELVDIIERKVRSGEISQQRINEAYQHIVTMKRSLVPVN